MQVNGYQIREAIRQWVTRRDLSNKQFSDSIYQFEDEKDRNISPQQIAANFQRADDAVALLESAQQLYNSKVSLTVQGMSMTLAYAVKRIGGAGRLEAMWRGAAGGRKRNRYSYEDRIDRKNKDEIIASRQVSLEDSNKQAEDAARFASALRNAVAAGNAQKIEIEIDPELLK